jgi:predicted ATP-grasp superfamily ATP-dependent carboligase
MLDPCSFPCPVLASSPKAAQESSNKLHLAKRLEALDMPHPHCYSPNELDTIEYPVIIKPATGGGGIFNRIAKNRQEMLAVLEELYRLEKGFTEKEIVIQQYLEGIPASVSLLSTKSESLAVAVNEQLIGIPWLSRMPFAYCGNVTPFRTVYSEEMETIAEELVLELGLLGSNGVDFLVTEKGPVVLEVNSRFQGSLDTVEKATGINLFEAHVGCFRGELPEKPEAKLFAARGVLYSDRELFIDRKLMEVILMEESADIPSQGTVTEPDWPLTSLFALASTRDEAVRSLEREVERIKTFIGRMKEKENL